MATVLAQGDSVLVVEMGSTAAGLELFQHFLDEGLQPVEAFTVLNGNFVILVSGKYDHLQKVHKKYSKMRFLDSVIVKQIQDEVLKAFYNLTKNSPKESLLVVETKTLSECFRLAQLAVNSKLDIVEFRSNRSLVGLNLLLITGPDVELEKFKKGLTKAKKVKNFKILKTNESFRSFFSFS